MEQSLDLASTILNVCNDAIRKRENVAQLQWLQERVSFPSGSGGGGEIAFVDEALSYLGARSLLLSGTLFKVKSKKELVAFLFNDMLFLAQPLNFSAATMTGGNFTLPMKPDNTLKLAMRAYRKPISTANVSLHS